MSTTMRHRSKTIISRRQLLKCAAASVLLINGCTFFRQESDFDAAMHELGNQLDEITADGDQEAVISILERIKSESDNLVTEHRTFVDSFERMLNHHATTETQLGQLINAYASRRAELRNGLLKLQDELHTLLTPGEWTEVVRILNRAGKSSAGYTLKRG